MSTVDIRPWGKFTQYTENEPTTVKIIEVNPGEQLSKQRHIRRDELWIALDHCLVAYVNDVAIPMDSGQKVFIPRRTIHTIKNWSSIEAARFLEIAFGHFDEDDIERLEDKYGRA